MGTPNLRCERRRRRWDTLRKTLDALGAGRITVKRAVKRLIDGDGQEQAGADTWDEVEVARAACLITEDDYQVLRRANDAGLFRHKRRPTGQPPRWMLELEERLTRQEAEDRRTPDEPGKRHDIRAYPGFADGGVTPREWDAS